MLPASVYDGHCSATTPERPSPMEKKKNEATQKLERLCNALADDVEGMSDEDLVAEMEELGEDADAIASRTAALIAEAIAKVGQRKLEAARAGYEAYQQSARPGNVLQWPTESKRDLIRRIAQNDPTLTFAARKEEDTEVDLDSAIEDLIELGVIDNEGNKT